jgi:protein gp37
MQETKIQWCDYSANLLKYRDASGKTAWACVKVSDGCKNCYAETLAHRYGRGGPYSLQQTRKVTPFFDIHEGNAILRAKKLAGKRVFIDDMTDLFGEWVSDEIIDKHFALFALRPDVTFQVLTKRPERMAAYLGQHDVGLRWALRTVDVGNVERPAASSDTAVDWTRNGLPNVWLGTSCEDQQRADERIPHLLKCPAAVRFLSCEPLLGPIDLTQITTGPDRDGSGWDYRHWNALTGENWCDCQDFIHPIGTGPVSWVIVGGESGSKARRFDFAWGESIVKQCTAAGVPVFFKQAGSNAGWTDADGDWHRWPTKDGKGGDPDEWPEDLRVREMPSVPVPA